MFNLICIRRTKFPLSLLLKYWGASSSLTESAYRACYEETLRSLFEEVRNNQDIMCSLSYTSPELWEWIEDGLYRVKNKSFRRKGTFLITLVLSRLLKTQLGSLSTTIVLPGSVNSNEKYVSDSPESILLTQQEHGEYRSNSGLRYAIRFDEGVEKLHCMRETSPVQDLYITDSDVRNENTEKDHKIPTRCSSTKSHELGRRTWSEMTKKPVPPECRRGVWDIIQHKVLKIPGIEETKIEHSLRKYVQRLSPAFKEIDNEKTLIASLLSSELAKNGSNNISIIEFICKYAKEIVQVRSCRSEGSDLWDLCFASDSEFSHADSATTSFEVLFHLQRDEITGAQNPHVVVDSLSPLGILSSRVDYFTGNSSQSSAPNDGLATPVEVINTMWLSTHYYAIRRHSLSSYVVLIGPRVTLPTGVKVIPLNELTLGLTVENGLSLYWQNQRLDPIWRNTLSPRASVMTLLLRYVSLLQPEIPSIPHYYPFSRIGKYEAIVYKNVLLSARKWVLPSSIIANMSQTSMSFGDYRNLRDIFESHQMPRIVVVVGDKDLRPRAIDTFNPHSLQILKRYSQCERLLFEETIIPNNTSSSDQYRYQYLASIV